MGQPLLVCKHLYREKFEHENYRGTDDILALVESGSFLLDDGSGTCTVNALEAVCFREGISYFRKVLQPVKLHLFRYHGGTNLFPSGKVTFRDTDRIRSTIRLLGCANSQEFYDDFALKQSLFDDIATQYRLENPLGLHALAKSDPLISRAVEDINNRLHEKFRLTDLAESYYLSYVQFSRRFKAAVGTTVQDYITDMRLKKAKSLLADSQMTMRQIANACGFANEFYFSNFFRQHQAMAPSEFRAIARSTETL